MCRSSRCEEASPCPQPSPLDPALHHCHSRLPYIPVRAESDPDPPSSLRPRTSPRQCCDKAPFRRLGHPPLEKDLFFHHRRNPRSRRPIRERNSDPLSRQPNALQPTPPPSSHPQTSPESGPAPSAPHPATPPRANTFPARRRSNSSATQACCP